jgi:hypothetical protein
VVAEVVETMKGINESSAKPRALAAPAKALPKTPTQPNDSDWETF